MRSYRRYSVVQLFDFYLFACEKIFVDKMAQFVAKSFSHYKDWSNSKLRKMHTFTRKWFFSSSERNSAFKCCVHLCFFVCWCRVNVSDSTINHLIGNWFKNCISLASNGRNAAYPWGSMCGYVFPGRATTGKIFYLAFRRSINNW